MSYWDKLCTVVIVKDSDTVGLQTGSSFLVKGSRLLLRPVSTANLLLYCLFYRGEKRWGKHEAERKMFPLFLTNHHNYTDDLQLHFQPLFRFSTCGQSPSISDDMSTDHRRLNTRYRLIWIVQFKCLIISVQIRAASKLTFTLITLFNDCMLLKYQSYNPQPEMKGHFFIGIYGLEILTAQKTSSGDRS